MSDPIAVAAEIIAAPITCTMHYDCECGDLRRRRRIALDRLADPLLAVARMAAQVEEHRTGRHGVVAFSCGTYLDQHVTEMGLALAALRTAAEEVARS